MKNWFRYIFYASIIFLVVALIRADYLVLPQIQNGLKLAISFLLLFAGFMMNTLGWSLTLRQAGYDIKWTDGITSAGLSIFAKYIPGKIWVIMGRAEYLANKYKYPRKEMGSFSFDAQFIALWSALLLGTAGMLWIKSLNVYGLSVLILFVFLSLVIYTPLLHRFVEMLLSRVLKRQVSFPRLSFARVLPVILWYLVSWGLWSLAFYFLAGSLSEYSIPFSLAFAFGLAGSIGILAVFAPGGLGVREGILTGFLTLAGLELPLATTIAVSSRLWFLVGEIFIFGVALLLRNAEKAG
jgi:uncharacterized membrane protein YbhN (UPF0104 family)